MSEKKEEMTQYEKDLEFAKGQAEDEEEEQGEEQEQVPNEEEEENLEPQEGEEDLEQEARAEGWVPLEEWNGPEETWVDAETFVKRGREILPIVNSKLSRTQKELQELRERFRSMERANKEVIKRQHDKHLSELEAVRKEAFEQQDYERFREVEKEMNELKSQAPEEESEEEEINQHPAIKDFLSKNPWYGQDEDLTAYADAISAKMEMPNATPEERLEALSSRVRKAFPHKFNADTKRRKSPPVESGNRGARRPSGNTKKKTYDDLPDEAKRACDEFVEDYGIMTAEEYVDSYFAQ